VPLVLANFTHLLHRNSAANNSNAIARLLMWNHDSEVLNLINPLGVANIASTNVFNLMWNHDREILNLINPLGVANIASTNHLALHRDHDLSHLLFGHHFWNENRLLNRFPGSTGRTGAAAVSARRTTRAGTTRAAA
jgi:hypothetical protein